MSKPNIVLVGSGGHAHACIDVIEQQNKYKIYGLVGLPDQVNEKLMGYSLLGCDSDLGDIFKKCKYALIAIGQMNSFDKRVLVYEKIIEIGFKLPVVVSPMAYISPYAQVGAGTIVMHGAVINSGAKVGNNCIVNSLSLIEHDTNIGDHCHISTGAILNGGVTVGSRTFIGSGSCLKQGVVVAERSFIGMGSVIRKNFNNQQVDCQNQDKHES